MERPPTPAPERTVLGLRISFLWGALVGALLVLTADVWAGVLDGPGAECLGRPTFFASR